MYRRKVHWLTTRCCTDFSHNEAMKPEEIGAVEEDLVDGADSSQFADRNQHHQYRSGESKGAMALFGVVDERVRVLTWAISPPSCVAVLTPAALVILVCSRIISESGTVPH